MIMRNKTKFFTVLLAVTIFFSCGNISDKKIRIAYANWAEGIAVTYLAKEILSEQGYRIELLNADIAPIFTSLARGKTDVFMDSWLPVTHADYFRKYNGKLKSSADIRQCPYRSCGARICPSPYDRGAGRSYRTVFRRDRGN